MDANDFRAFKIENLDTYLHYFGKKEFSIFFIKETMFDAVLVFK